MTFLGKKVLLSIMGNANFSYQKFTYIYVLTFVLVGEGRLGSCEESAVLDVQWLHPAYAVE